MAEDEPFSIGHLVSAIWSALYMFFFPYLVRAVFEDLFMPWSGDQVDYVVRQLLAFDAVTITGCIALIGAFVCVVSATIHLILLATRKKRFARRYRLIRNISAATAFVSVIVGLYAWAGLFDE
jgi:hypothetical protein